MSPLFLPSPLPALFLFCQHLLLLLLSSSLPVLWLSSTLHQICPSSSNALFYRCYFWCDSYYVTFVDVCVCFTLSLCIISYSFLHAPLSSHLTFFLLFPLSFHPLSCLSSRPSLCTTRPFPSAHVDMSTATFDVDPLDLDAEEPPENQGDPRSSKGMSGSVTSPQANAHRLPFFKKVTPGAQDAADPSPLLQGNVARCLWLLPPSLRLPPSVSH